MDSKHDSLWHGCCGRKLIVGGSLTFKEWLFVACTGSAWLLIFSSCPLQ